jgi:hypothetical protein
MVVWVMDLMALESVDPTFMDDFVISMALPGFAIGARAPTLMVQVTMKRQTKIARNLTPVDLIGRPSIAYIRVRTLIY